MLLVMSVISEWFNVLSLKAKFHYASWFEAGRRQVPSWSFEPDSVI